MNQLIEIKNKEGQLVVSSRQIARDFGKNHRDILKAIDDLISQMGVAKNYADLFILSKYVQEQNKQTYREYLITRDGFSLLVMGFTGNKALEWKLKYIEAFNKMEKTIKTGILGNLSTEMQALLMHDKKIQAVVEHIEDTEQKLSDVDQDLQSFKKDMPLLGIDLERIKKARNKKIVPLLGGKNSQAYKDNSLRGKVYSDSAYQVWREFGVDSFKEIKRCQCDIAIKIIDKYELPLALKEEVDYVNSQICL